MEYTPIDDIAVALITHMDEGNVDALATKAHVIALQDEGMTTAVLQGTTGSGLYLRPEVLEQQVAALHTSGLRLIGGVIKKSYVEVKEQLAMINKLDVFESVLVAPYVDLPEAELPDFYQRVRDLTDLPIIAYNIPGRTNCPLSPEFVNHAGQAGITSAVKNSGPTPVAYNSDLLQVLCGNDRNQAEIFIEADKKSFPIGAISGASNYIPFFRLEQEILLAVRSGEYETAQEIQNQLDYAFNTDLNVVPAEEPYRLRELAEAWNE